MNGSNQVLNQIEWAGMTTGLLGSALLALKLDVSGYGFVLYLVSNVFWIYAGRQRGSTALMAMMICYSMASLYGIYRWMLVT